MKITERSRLHIGLFQKKIQNQEFRYHSCDENGYIFATLKFHPLSRGSTKLSVIRYEIPYSSNDRREELETASFFFSRRNGRVFVMLEMWACEDTHSVGPVLPRIKNQIFIH